MKAERRRIRLIELSKKRQVIIFTHNIAFLSKFTELKEAECKLYNVKIRDGNSVRKI